MAGYLDPIIALLAGAAIGAQISMNARLGVLLRSSLLGTAAAVGVSAVLTSLIAVASTRSWPSQQLFRKVPPYLWISGGLLSAVALCTFYSLAPRMGVGRMVSYALTGQLLLAVASSHWGWFALPTERIGSSQIVGLLAMSIGVFCMNGGRP